MIVKYLGKRAALLADELSFEKEISYDDFFLHSEVEPYLFKCTLASEGKKFIYLSLGLIN